MLKIKDNVDLKELEKFGFKKDEEEQYIVEDKDMFIGSEDDERELVLDFGFNNENIYILYDMIQAGLVEKIEEVSMEEKENTCLQCGSGKQVYCEECYQKLIAENAKLQRKINELEKEKNNK